MHRFCVTGPLLTGAGPASPGNREPARQLKPGPGLSSLELPPHLAPIPMSVLSGNEYFPFGHL